MAFSKITKDMNIISALDDEPNDVGGLSAAQLKAKFDEGGLAVKQAYNDHIDELVASTAADNIGAKDANGDPSTVQAEIDNIRGTVIDTIPDGAITTPKLQNGAVTTAKLADPAPSNVGVIIQSVRTDLGARWALCNGDEYDPTTYAELAAVLPPNEFPQKNLNGQSGGYSAVYGLHNGEFAALKLLNQQINIIAADGSLKYTCTVNGTTWDGGSLKAVEHNGTKYVAFVTAHSTTLRVWSTTDFSTYTQEKEITLTNAFNYGMPVCANFDGTYYYLWGDNANSSPTAHPVIILDDAFNVVSETSIGYADAKVTMCGNKAYAIVYNSSKIYVAPLNGSVPASLTGYRNITAVYGAKQYAHIIPFNASYDLYYTNDEILVFIPTDGTSALKSYSLPADAYGAFLSGDGSRLIVYKADGTKRYVCNTAAANPASASAWTTEDLYFSDAGTTLSAWGGDTQSWRYSTGRLIGGTMVVRAPLLPIVPSSGYYTYIKVKE